MSMEVCVIQRRCQTHSIQYRNKPLEFFCAPSLNLICGNKNYIVHLLIEEVKIIANINVFPIKLRL